VLADRLSSILLFSNHCKRTLQTAKFRVFSNNIFRTHFAWLITKEKAISQKIIALFNSLEGSIRCYKVVCANAPLNVKHRVILNRSVLRGVNLINC